MKLNTVNSLIKTVAIASVFLIQNNTIAQEVKAAEKKTEWPEWQYGMDYDASIEANGAPRLLLNALPKATQGPLWPPGEFMNEDGDFVVIGNTVEEMAPGVMGMIPNRSVIVSKNTVPPLDENGSEFFMNPFAAPYSIVKELDLSEGSPDLDMVLYTNSFGPPKGNFGGAGRIPREGDTEYNLNSRDICLDLFPAESQVNQYQQPSFPLHRAPIWGMQGDGVAFNVNTGAQFDPNLKSGSNCPPPGCSGENAIDDWPIEDEITIGRYLEAEGQMRIILTDFEDEAGGYTGAHFGFRFVDLLPNSVYTIWALRSNFFHPGPFARVPDPITLSNVFISDKSGRSRISFDLDNPFPAHDVDDAGTRIIGIVIVYHSDQVSWSACPGRTSPGVETHTIFSTMTSGWPELTDMVTVAPTNGE